MAKEGELDWATVVRLDEPLQETAESDLRDETLEVPSLTDETLDRMAQEHGDSETTSQPEQQRAEPGSQVECEICGRSVRVRKDGFLSAHKCEPKKQRGNRLGTIPSRRPPTPKRVRDFGIGVLTWSIEEGTAHMLARPFNVDPDTVPTELPDADEMVGPILDLVWPQIPEGAQKFFERIADESDLIACALAWAEWTRQLGKWTREQRAYQRSLIEQERQHAPTQFAATDGTNGRVVPFSPAQP